VTEVRSFMGLASYYQRFIKGFSNIASPITSLQKKGVKIEWTPKCEESFQQLKEFLTSASILKITDPDEYFVVCTNACKEGLIGVLTQKYHKMNYATHDLELETIVHALQMWRPYLMGKKFEIRKNHCGLKRFFGQPTLNAIQTRWIEFLSEYDFEIKHIKGKKNQV
jgi:hypothetical protein